VKEFTANRPPTRNLGRLMTPDKRILSRSHGPDEDPEHKKSGVTNVRTSSHSRAKDVRPMGADSEFFNEHQQRRLLATCKHIESLLSDMEASSILLLPRVRSQNTTPISRLSLGVNATEPATAGR